MADKEQKRGKSDRDAYLYDSMSTVVQEIIRCASMRNQSCVPGIVEEYDRDTHSVAVRPLVNYVSYDGEDHEHEVRWTTLYRLQSGGFLIDMPVFKGDVGWIIGSDRDAQTAKDRNSSIQESDTCKMKDGKMDYGSGNKGPQKPSSYELHSFNSGFFIPDSWAKIKIQDRHRESLLIQTVDSKGAASGIISISRDGKVGIESVKGLEIDADVSSKGNARHDGDMEISGKLLLGSRRVSISESDLVGKHEARFRKVRFVTTDRDGKLVYQTAYMLSTDAVPDGKNQIAVQNNNMAVGDGGGESVEYVLQSGANSYVRFSVDGGSETSSVTVDKNLSGKTVGINVYYV